MVNNSVINITGYVTKNQGENLTMVCTTTEETDHVGLFLYARLPEKHQVFYYDKSSKAVTPNKEYIGKVNTSGEIQNLTITITGLQERDSGFYSCVYNSLSGARVTEKETNGVLLFVKEVQPPRSTEAPGKEPSAMPEMLVLVSALTACAVVILCFLVAGVWVIPKVKALCAEKRWVPRERDDGSKSHNAVYEDMRAHRAPQAV
ncbi:hypothetical protein NFI96_021897 [Prochilodus magdalenae]|nr:hypothetical protein NFI96_021897 [Prochilodus magdalenae]